MAVERIRTTRIVMMTSALMKLYEVRGFRGGAEYQPITFCNPHDCLEMLVNAEHKEPEPEAENPTYRAQKMEKQWGELELRLSFFTDGYKWQ